MDGVNVAGVCEGDYVGRAAGSYVGERGFADGVTDIERGERRDVGVVRVGGVPWAPMIQKLADSEW